MSYANFKKTISPQKSIYNQQLISNDITHFFSRIFVCILNTLPERAKALYLFPTLNAFALSGRGDSTMREPQGVASLALGYVLHWAFSPPLLNPKLE